MKKKHKKMFRIGLYSGIIFVFFYALFFYERNVFRDFTIFLKAFFDNRSSVGAVAPNSSFLANAITKYIHRENNPIRILEVGAGTGSTTEKILKKLKKDDILDLIELDSNFCKVLNRKVAKIKNVHVHCLSILDWNPKYHYDFIISGLPFNNFDANFIKLILEKYKKLIKPDGIISYFEYIALGKIKLFFLRGNKRSSFLKTINTTTNFRNKFEFDKESIFINIPPANVYHLRINNL